MRILTVAALGLCLGAGLAPVRAQNLGDVGRQLKDQLLPGQNQSQDRDRNAYEQGRRDQEEQARRQRDSARGSDSRGYDDRRRADDRNRRGVEEADRDRRGSDYNRNSDNGRPRSQYDDPPPRSRY